MLIHYQLVHLVSFVIAKRGKVSAPKAKSRSNWGFRFRRMTGKPAEAGTRPSPWSLHMSDCDPRAMSALAFERLLRG
jgi:hypothetical protein